MGNLGEGGSPVSSEEVNKDRVENCSRTVLEPWHPPGRLAGGHPFALQYGIEPLLQQSRPSSHQ